MQSERSSRIITKYFYYRIRALKKEFANSSDFSDSFVLHVCIKLLLPLKLRTTVEPIDVLGTRVFSHIWYKAWGNKMRNRP